MVVSCTVSCCSAPPVLDRTKKKKKKPMKRINSIRLCNNSVYLNCLTKGISLSVEKEYDNGFSQKSAAISVSAVNTHFFSAVVYHYCILARARKTSVYGG